MRGFTLLEMLIAVAIIGVIGASVATAIGSVANQTRSLEQRTVASWIASNHLTRMRMLQRRNAQLVAEGRSQTRMIFADREWEVETHITATDHPWIRRVEVAVFAANEDDDRAGPFSQLSGFLGQY
ncbi:MAG: type II secretion system minor pseudopilin GspI [Proteobacteria bacterium]|nr:type II secretion system minor pseudopilin GspI [Pseudomonadota bacterium]